MGCSVDQRAMEEGRLVSSFSTLSAAMIDKSIGTMQSPSPLSRWGAFILSPRSRVHLCISSLVMMRDRIVTTRVTMTYVFAFIGDFSSLSRWQTINVKSLVHKREIKKKTRGGDQKIRKTIKAASKVRSLTCFATTLTPANRSKNVKT